MRTLFFDTETTGNADGDRLVQLGIKERGIAEPLVNALYKPPLPIAYEAMAIHHITEKMVEDRPAFVASPEYTDIKAAFEDEDIVSVAHNAAFDLAILRREGIKPANIICTYKVASALDTEEQFSHYSLQYLRYALGMDVVANAHDAMGDVLVLEALFENLLAKLAETQGSEELAVKEMLDISSKPKLFTTIRFGKHKGKRIEEIARQDRGYLEWLLREKKKEGGEEDWVYTLEHFLAQ
ncbi:MAG TPA: exonuclease domain-containing protein [Candidatus Paceibacterota bacterium]|nr:exonuclease domain-containing protein [Candidatus Paceibacterota bacterium]